MAGQINLDFNKTETPIINIVNYSLDRINQSEYNILKQFSQINPILDKIPTIEALENNTQNFTLKLKNTKEKVKEDRKPIEDNLIYENQTIPKGLESLLQTPSPIFITPNTQNNTYDKTNLSYSNQNQQSLIYKNSQNQYPRSFAWYDMPKQNIIPGYYKRH